MREPAVRNVVDGKYPQYVGVRTQHSGVHACNIDNDVVHHELDGQIAIGGCHRAALRRASGRPWEAREGSLSYRSLPPETTSTMSSETPVGPEVLRIAA